MPADRRHELFFSAMGSSVHIIVVGGDIRALRVARERIDDLDRRWSRFRPASEIGRINHGAGSPVVVSRDTLALIRRSLEAFVATEGRFDPTVLGDLIRAGYDRSFELLDPDAAAGRSSLTAGASAISVDLAGSSVRLPDGVGFDPGGIGKGFAADIVVEELLSVGAHGACVNVGGDIRAEGSGPGGANWCIALEDDHVGLGTRDLLSLRSGAVATSSRLRRAWGPLGDRRHHLIDPRTGAPSDGEIDTVTVVAAEGWQAEAATKAASLGSVRDGLRAIERLGVEGIVTTRDGIRHVTGGLHRFLMTSAMPGAMMARPVPA
jgi:thiamine biosynthesis lipoprotein